MKKFLEKEKKFLNHCRKTLYSTVTSRDTAHSKCTAAPWGNSNCKVNPVHMEEVVGEGSSMPAFSNKVSETTIDGWAAASCFSEHYSVVAVMLL